MAHLYCLLAGCKNLESPMMSLVRPRFSHVLPSLETGCRRYIYRCHWLGGSIRKGRAPPILATGKPSNAEGEEKNGESTASDGPSAEAQPQNSDSERRTRNSVWQRLPVVGSRFGGQKVASSEGGSMEVKWSGILDPTPDNLLALLLTGLLGLAALQIFWQLLLVAVTITLAALKYSVIAAILLALLIVFL